MDRTEEGILSGGEARRSRHSAGFGIGQTAQRTHDSYGLPAGWRSDLGALQRKERRHALVLSRVERRVREKAEPHHAGVGNRSIRIGTDSSAREMNHASNA